LADFATALLCQNPGSAVTLVAAGQRLTIGLRALLRPYQRKMPQLTALPVVRQDKLLRPPRHPGDGTGVGLHHTERPRRLLPVGQRASRISLLVAAPVPARSAGMLRAQGERPTADQTPAFRRNRRCAGYPSPEHDRPVAVGQGRDTGRVLCRRRTAAAAWVESLLGRLAAICIMRASAMQQTVVSQSESVGLISPEDCIHSLIVPDLP